MSSVIHTKQPKKYMSLLSASQINLLLNHGELVITRTKTMTKRDAIKFMQEGHRVSHRFFAPHEWATIEHHAIKTEGGVTVPLEEYFRHRNAAAWDESWYNVDSLPLSLGNCSLDVHLHSIKRVSFGESIPQHRSVEPPIIDTALPFEEQAQLVDMPLDEYPAGIGTILRPNEFYLATVEENLEKVPTYLVADISGKSSLARWGLEVHKTAGWGDAGFQGYFTLEITVEFPMIVYIGMPIAQIRFNMLKHFRSIELLCEDRYNTKYQDQPQEPIASKFHLNYNPHTGKWN